MQQVSLSFLGRLVLPLAVLLLPVAVQAQAQNSNNPQAAFNADAAATPEFSGPIDLTVTRARKPTRCGVTDSRGEIVVCGGDRGEDLKVPGSADDPNSREGLNNGVPQAPSVSGLVDCKVKKCRNFGRVPPPVFVIDLKSIPEAPKGSDAEKVANGEISDR